VASGVPRDAAVVSAPDALPQTPVSTPDPLYKNDVATTTYKRGSSLFGIRQSYTKVDRAFDAFFAP
jgi:hypothetical protein